MQKAEHGCESVTPELRSLLASHTSQRGSGSARVSGSARAYVSRQ